MHSIANQLFCQPRLQGGNLVLQLLYHLLLFLYSLYKGHDKFRVSQTVMVFIILWRHDAAEIVANLTGSGFHLLTDESRVGDVALVRVGGVFNPGLLHLAVNTQMGIQGWDIQLVGYRFEPAVRKGIVGSVYRSWNNIVKIVNIGASKIRTTRLGIDAAS